MKIVSVVGARPNFMKIAPIAHALKKTSIKHVLVHTGQHYDEKMSKLFFEDLKIPQPDIYMGIGSDTHAKQTAKIMTAFEDVLLEHKPDLVLVVGDVNSTMAATVVAAKMNIPVAHVEAGLRSFDRAMPEEINRMLTDSISDILFTTSSDADENLVKEGVDRKRIFLVGNVMIDTLMAQKEAALRSNILTELGVKENEYALVTLHRPSNVDHKENLTNLLDVFEQLQSSTKIIFPVHPRTRQKFDSFGLTQKIAGMKNLIFVEPLGYLEFMKLMMSARIVFTDSGGVQEETSCLGVPCLTLRENTERPITITHGTNHLVGMSKPKILKTAQAILKQKEQPLKKIPYWDGKAAERIVKALQSDRVTKILERRKEGK